jgi:FMN phosphatase YigB (HAD superfamily)
MRAKTVYRRCYVFDFDETLVKTSAKIRIYRNNVFVKSLTPKEYNFYVPNSKDKIDFDEFQDGEMILNAKKYIVWPVIKNVSNAIKEDRSTSDIYILTARNTQVKAYIYEFLKRNGIDIDIRHIITIGDDIIKRGVNIANEKLRILKLLRKKYDEIILFDDNPETIRLAASIPGIKTKLIESRNAR